MSDLSVFEHTLRTLAWVHSWPGCTLVSGSEDTGTFCRSYRSEYVKREREIRKHQDNKQELTMQTFNSNVTDYA